MGTPLALRAATAARFHRRADLIFLGRCRAAAVKGGRRPSRNDLPLMVASTAADLLDWGGPIPPRVSFRTCFLARFNVANYDDTEGSSPSGASIAPQTCIRSIREDRNHDAVMRIAAKLRGGGPILRRGSKTKSQVGLPPPRSVSCSLASR